MSRSPRPLDVAIVGMACRFAGAADLFAYWENVLAGRDAIRDVPPDRWDAGEFFDPDSSASDRVGGRRGGYLDGPVLVDPAALGVMPRTLEGGEPEQFLALDAARSALRDAGLEAGIPDGRRVEVVIGRGNYFNRGNLTRLQHGRVLSQTLAILRALHPDWTDAQLDEVREDLRRGLPPFEAATIPGQLTNATAGRVGHRLGLTGPCYVVDAASASALVALDLGARALASGRADLAIVGGVYIEADVDFPMVFSRLGVLSRSGTPRPFGADADGMVPGEGVGVVVLRRLADAERDGDRIYAVVKGVGLASDGRGRGLASPDAKGHLRAIRRAYRGSGVDPGTVGLVEGHGLGVPAADRAEIRALRAAFPPLGPGEDRVLGAASALVGHAMPAAGMAGLIKAALALHHRALPTSPGPGEPHPILRRSSDRLRLNPESRPWIGGRPTPRRAGVDAFGFAGINAHAVLEEHPSSDGDVPGALLRWPDEAVLLAAEDRRGLAERAARLASRLRRRPDLALKDVASALNAEAIAAGAPARLGIVAGSTAELADRLESAGRRLADPARSSIRDARGAYYWDEPAGARGGLAFLFPGEGSQYPGMLADVCLHFPEVRASFDQIDRMARASGAVESPSARLFAAGGPGGASLWDASLAVHVVLASQWALYRLLRRLGLRPDAYCGHSSGEFLALVAAGAISNDDLLEGRFNELAALFSSLETSGAIPEARLLGVAAGRDRVEAVLAERAGSVSVAADNCPHQVVLVGPPGEVEEVAGRLRAAQVACEDLPFSRAYHSPAFAAALGPVREFFEATPIARPGVPVYSCCEARPLPDREDEIRRLAIAQWTRPVEFRRAVEAMHADGLRVFVDVGGRGNLAAFVEDTLRGRPAFAAAANVPRRSGLTQLNHLVASLFAQGVPLDPAVLYARRRPAPIDLDAGPPSPSALVPLRLGFPEMRLSEGLAARLRESRPGPSNVENGRDVEGRPAGPLRPDPRPDHDDDDRSWPGADGVSEEDAAVESFLGTMRSFLETQRRTLAAYLGPGASEHEGNGAAFDAPAPDPAAPGPNGSARHRRASTPPREPVASGMRAAHGQPAGAVALLEPERRTERPAGDAAGAGPRDLVVWQTLDARGDPVAEHHTFGGRRISEVDPTLKGLPVLPFTVMAELLAEAASRLAPGAVLVGLRDVRARRWIRYEEEPIRLEIRVEADGDRPGAFRASLYNRGPEGRPARGDDRPEVEAVVEFADHRPGPDQPSPFDLGPSAAPTRFTARSIYDEQWLFHGPALRAVVGIGEASERGIEGTLRVLPRRALRRDPSSPPPLTDPIVLDAFTHLLGCWGLDQLSEGDVIFPLRLGSLRIFGEDPPEGADLACRIAVKAVDRHRVTVDAEILRPDGRVWMRLADWDDWRFDWPPRYRDVFRRPDRELLGEPMDLPGLGPDAVAVWLEPPADMGRPIWRDVLEQIQLSPEERAGCLRPAGPEGRRTLRLWGRIAAKEAVRRLWLAEGGPPVYPADLTIEPDPRGRPIVRSRREPDRADLPAVSIAHTEGVAVALASRRPDAALGIDVERVAPRSPSFEELAFTPGERALLDRLGGDARPAWSARLWCAKEAAGKATGLGMVAGPPSVEVTAIDPEGGRMAARLGPDLAAARPDLAAGPLEVGTALRGEYAYAWAVAEGERR